MSRHGNILQMLVCRARLQNKGVVDGDALSLVDGGGVAVIKGIVASGIDLDTL